MLCGLMWPLKRSKPPYRKGMYWVKYHPCVDVRSGPHTPLTAEIWELVH